MKQPKYITIEDLVLMGVDEQDAIDWFGFRGKKKLTERGLKSIVREAGKLGWSLPRAVKKMADKEWIGFEAGWVDLFEEKQGFIERHTDRKWADGLDNVRRLK